MTMNNTKTAQTEPAQAGSVQRFVRRLNAQTVASGAGFGYCPCGWRSGVADDGNDLYTFADIRREFDEHVCSPNDGTQRGRDAEATNATETRTRPSLE